jgi:hypothetical protein
MVTIVGLLIVLLHAVAGEKTTPVQDFAAGVVASGAGRYAAFVNFTRRCDAFAAVLLSESAATEAVIRGRYGADELVIRVEGPSLQVAGAAPCGAGWRGVPPTGARAPHAPPVLCTTFRAPCASKPHRGCSELWGGVVP